MSASSNPAIPPPPSSSTATPPPLRSFPPPSPTPIPPMAQLPPPPPPPIPESPPPAPPISPQLPVMPSPPPSPDISPPPSSTPSMPIVPPPSPPVVPPPKPPPSPSVVPPPQPPPSPPVAPPPQPTPSPPVVPPPKPPPSPSVVPPPQPPPSPPVAPPPQPTPSPPVVPPPKPPPSPSVVPPPQPPPSPPVAPPPQPTPSPPVPPPQPTPSPPIQPPPPQPPPSPPVTSQPNSSPPPPSPTTPSPPPPTPSGPPQSPPSEPKSPPPPDIQPPSKQPPPPPNTPTRLPSPPPSNSSVPVNPRLILSPPPPDTPSSPTNSSPTNSSNTPPGTVVTVGKGSSSNTKTETMVGIVVAVAFVLLLGALIVWCMKRRKKNGGYVMPTASVRSPDSQLSERVYSSAPLFRTPSSSQGVYSPPEPGPGNSKPRFTYEELSDATNGFSPQNILGEGGFGCVYKGWLPDGRNVAVKQLKVGGRQGEREFQAEVEIISRVHHRHLVSLVGCCIEKNQKLLVYDFVPNNTLHYHLHEHGRPVMDWATRIKVAAGAARGIAYLHEDCQPRIIHRDIKSSNILLDNFFEAQVSDFGLAKLTLDAQTHVTTRVMGTFGYMAPEYASSGKLTDRSDVFSFGVVLLELITGRKPVDSSQPLGDESLVEWARPLMSRALETGSFEGLPDSRLLGNYDENEMFIMIEAAAACVRHSAPMRPRMGVVMRALDDLTENMDLQNGVRPGNSELYTGANSEEIRIFNNMAFGGLLYTSDFSNSAWNNQQ